MCTYIYIVYIYIYIIIFHQQCDLGMSENEALSGFMLLLGSWDSTEMRYWMVLVYPPKLPVSLVKIMIDLQILHASSLRASWELLSCLSRWALMFDFFESLVLYHLCFAIKLVQPGAS